MHTVAVSLVVHMAAVVYAYSGRVVSGSHGGSCVCIQWPCRYWFTWRQLCMCTMAALLVSVDISDYLKVIKLVKEINLWLALGKF